MPTAVIYCRVSNVSADRDNNTGLEQQEAANRTYCEERGYTVLEVVRETASGATLERPGVWRAIDAIRCGKADRLVVYALDRLSRDQTHQAVLIHSAEEKYGGKVESTREDYDNTPTGALLRSIAGHVAEMERINVVARMSRGKLARAKKDKLMPASNPTYGYRWADDAVGQRTSFEVDETTADVVRRVFALYLSGLSIRAVAKALNADGVPTPAAHAASQGHIGRRPVGKGWQPVQVYRILKEESYIGKKTAYRLQVVVRHAKDASTGEMKKHKRIETREEGRIALSCCPAIISEADFMAVQALFASNKLESVRNNHTPQALLLRGGILVCAACGANMRGMRRTGGGAYRYVCPNRGAFNPNPHTVCSSPSSVAAQAIDDDVWADVSKVAAKTEGGQGVSLLYRAAVDRVGNLLERVRQRNGRISAARETAQGLEEQRDNLLSSLRETSNPSTRVFLVKELDSLQDQIDKAEAYRQGLAASEAETDSEREWLDRLIDQVEAAVYPASTYEEKRNVLRLLGVKVKLHKEVQDNGKRWTIGYDIELQTRGVS
jgi:DNA invertase Pin-like site-specific DNA recombinase